MVGIRDLRLVGIIRLKVPINFCKNLKIPPKIRNFLWRATLGVLPTCIQLQKCHVPVNVDCPLCNAHAKTVHHALVECEFAKDAWNRSMVDVWAEATTFSSWLLGIFGRGHEGEMEEVTVVSWAIWRARNEFVWQKKSWPASNIVASARNMLNQYKFAQGRKGLSLSPLHDGGRNLERWITLELNKIKVNVDGALFEQEGRFGMASVARNHHGAMVEVFKKGKIGCV
ncbi:hypothetical protein CsatB_022508 [Cannabis sativa]